MKKNIYQKIWEAHLVCEPEGEDAILYIDRHYIHEVTSPQAFEGLRLSDRKVRRPDLTYATMDHNIPTTDRSLPIADILSRRKTRRRSPSRAESISGKYAESDVLFHPAVQWISLL